MLKMERRNVTYDRSSGVCGWDPPIVWAKLELVVLLGMEGAFVPNKPHPELALAALDAEY